MLLTLELMEYSDLVLFFVRVVLGTVMIYYGYPKIVNLKSNAKDFVSMGFKPGMFWGSIVAFIEFIGGIAIVIGLFVDLFALLYIVQMFLGASWKIVSAEKPFTDWSYDLQIMMLALILLTFGSGIYSLAIPFFGTIL